MTTKKKLTPNPAPAAPPEPASTGQERVRVDIPVAFRPHLLTAYHARQSAAHQLQALHRQIAALEQQAVNAHGELGGLVKAVAIAAGADPAAEWDLSADCTHLVKRG